MKLISCPQGEIYHALPLFSWANRHRAKPATLLKGWTVDGQLNVTAVEVKYG